MVLLSDKKRDESGMSLKIEDAMVKEVMTIDDNATVKEAAEIMNKFEIGCLMLLGKEKPWA